MRTVLNARIYVRGDARKRALKSPDSQIKNAGHNMDVSHDLSLTSDGYPEVYLDGSDKEKLKQVLHRNFGAREDNPSIGKRYKGTLESWNETGFTLDIGQETIVPASHLEDKLGRGTPSQIRDRFGLVQHIPLELEYGDESHLTENQIDALWSWRKNDQGRLNVNSCTRAEIRATVNRAGHSRDIHAVERLGLLEQSLICDADTDPPGLLADIGNYVKGEMLCVVT